MGITSDQAVQVQRDVRGIRDQLVITADALNAALAASDGEVADVVKSAVERLNAVVATMQGKEFAALNADDTADVAPALDKV